MSLCYVCERDSVGQCKQCGRFYCTRHGGGSPPADLKVTYCKYCLIGQSDPRQYWYGMPIHSDDAIDLVWDIAESFRYHAWAERNQDTDETRRNVLTVEQAERLLRMLLGRLMHDDNVYARLQVAHALRYLVEGSYGIWAWENWSKFGIVKEAVGVLMTVLSNDDEHGWVRDQAACSLVNMQYREALKAIIEAYRDSCQRAEAWNIEHPWGEGYASPLFEGALREVLRAWSERKFPWRFGLRWTEEDVELVRSVLKTP